MEEVIDSSLPHEDKERDIAYEHPHIAHLNIFRPLHGQKDEVLRVYGAYGDEKTKAGKTTIEVMMPNQLSIKDEDLLLAVYSLARPKYHTNKVTTQDDFYVLTPKKHKPSTVNVHISKYELLQMLNKNKGGKNYQDLNKSLKRISETSISYANKKCKGTTFLLSYCDFEDEGVSITLNPLSAFILLGETAPYVRYVREDRVKLRGDIARRVHSIFSASLHKGKGSIGLHPLAFKIHGNEFGRGQISRLKGALEQIKKELPNWKVSTRGRGEKTMVYYSYKK